MKVLEKEFSNNIQEKVRLAKQKVHEKYGLHPVNNINLICEKLIGLASTAEVYVECGVFQGTTFFSVATFLEQQSIDLTLFGLDTFEGFPGEEIDHRDRPQCFAQLLEKGLITEDHYRKAAQRTRNFTDESHLTKEYYLDVKKVFDIAKEFDNIHLIRGAFKETFKTIDQPIAVLFLDCDLYQSYLDCLNGLYPKVISGGVVIFDEYYSLKYPGPRLAVNEFFKDKMGYFERYLSGDGFERWCYVKD